MCECVCETHGGQLVEASKQLVKQLDQLLGAAGGGELGEAHDVCKQDAEERTHVSQDASPARPTPPSPVHLIPLSSHHISIPSRLVSFRFLSFACLDNLCVDWLADR